MKLYMVPLAPNPTKVMLYIAEREQLGVLMNIEQIVVNTVKGRHKEPAHLARNPFGTVPTLEMATVILSSSPSPSSNTWRTNFRNTVFIEAHLSNAPRLGIWSVLSIYE